MIFKLRDKQFFTKLNIKYLINNLFIKLNDYNKTLIYHHNPDLEYLPFEGWYHNCMICSVITGKERDYKLINYNIKIIVCKDCKHYLK